ncbi:MAG TPA: ABC transporter ATP-binding protein [Terriglobia bacterium]|nr:ABC transporter ATP-binding protein [Terriglobia bacterium]
MPETAIHVEGLGKRYRIGQYEKYRALRDTLTDAMYAPARMLSALMSGKRNGSGRGANYFWALSDVSMDIREGEVVGLIGRNGAGKSTLLKILSRLTEPTQGRARIRGRVGSLLEVGTGFHPELTGRENIYLSGAILGMRKREIDRNFDAIVDFAEMGKFVDTPVKFYSSGMYVRLAFAVAAHLEPEVLLIDEVLAVGDAGFQKKCLGKMDDIAGTGRTIIFVSHNMAAVQNLCTSAYLLSDGRVAASGNTNEIVSQYLKEVSSVEQKPLSERTDRHGSGKIRFEKFRVLSEGQEGFAVFGNDTRLLISYTASAPLRNVHISMGIYTPFGQAAAYLSNELVGKFFEEAPREGVFECRIDKLPLIPGTYSVNVFCTVNGVIADYVKDAARFTVQDGDFYGSGKLPPKDYGAVAVRHDFDLLTGV